MNSAMQRIRADIDWHERHPYPAWVTSLIERGVVDTNRGLLQAAADQGFHPDPTDFPDVTSVETTVNQFRIDCADPVEAAAVGHRAAHAVARILQEETLRSCRVVLSVEESTIRPIVQVRVGRRAMASTTCSYSTRQVLHCTRRTPRLR